MTEPERFTIHSQTETDTENDRVDENMAPASAVAQFPSLDPRDVARDQARTARRQARREPRNDDRARHRNHGPSQSNRDRGHDGFPPIITTDIRRLPSGPSNSFSSSSTASLRPTAKTPPFRRGTSPMRGRYERNVRQRSEEPGDITPMDFSPDVQDHRPREGTQADYANSVLNGTANLGDSLETFSNTVRRDLTQFSTIKDNCYLLDFYEKRSNSILPPSMDITSISENDFTYARAT